MECKQNFSWWLGVAASAAVISLCLSCGADANIHVSPSTLSGHVALTTSGTAVRYSAEGIDFDMAPVGSDGRFVLTAEAGDWIVKVKDSMVHDLFTGTLVHSGSLEQCAAALDVMPPAEVSLEITPWTTLSVDRARALSNQGQSFSTAYLIALSDWNTLLGCAAPGADIVTATPSDLNAEQRTEFGPAHVSAALTGGLGVLAHQYGVSFPELLEAIGRDVRADGFSDGLDAGRVAITLPGGTLGPDTLRQGLAQGTRVYLESQPELAASASADYWGKFFRCLTDTTSVVTGNLPPAAPFDVMSPSVSIYVPEANTVTNGSVAIRCGAQDSAGINAKRMAVWAQFPGSEERLSADLFRDVHTEANNGETFISATFDSKRLPNDGLVRVYCFAEDNNLNRTTTHVEVTVNNSGAIVSVLEPKANDVLAGNVDVVCSCIDAQPVTCSLVQPSPAAGAVECEEFVAESGTLTCHWETTQESDGESVVSCEATAAGLATIKSSTSVRIKNLKPVRYRGVVAGATPVTGTTVTARECANGIPGTVIASTVATESAFEILVDAPREWICFEAMGPEAKYQNSINGDWVVLGPGTVLRTIIEHQPAMEEKTVNFSISGVTTLAMQTCKSRVLRFGEAFALACSNAHYYWGYHLNRVAPFDPRFVIPANLLGQDPTSSGNDALAVSLWHASVEAWGRILTDQLNLPAGSLAWHRSIVFDARDLEDAVYDSRDSQGLSIQLASNYALNSETRRGDTAVAGIRWMRVPFDSSGIQNRAGLQINNWRTFFENQATDNSPMFSSIVPSSLDWDPPSLTSSVSTENNGTKVCVTASERSSLLEFASDGDLLTNITVSGNKLCGTVVTTGRSDGAYAAHVHAVDANGNRSNIEVSVDINQNAPEIAISAPADGVAVSGVVPIQFDCADGNGIAVCDLVAPANLTVSLTGDGKRQALWPTDGIVSEGPYSVTVRATDTGGRASTKSFTVIVSNWAEGTVNLSASLGAWLRDSKVMIYALPGGDFIGQGRTDDKGNVAVRLSDPPITFGKYIDVRVTEGRTKDLIRNTDLAMRPSDRLRSILPYVPSYNGTIVSGVQINAVSTCAAELADVFIAQRKRPTLAENIEFSYRLWDDLLVREGSEEGVLDSRYVQPSDMTTDWSTDASFRRYLGMFHAGLAWDAANHAYKASRDLGEYTILDHLVRICRRDLMSSKLDGLDEMGNIVTSVGGGKITSFTTRFDAAYGIFWWLDGLMPDLTTPLAVNKTTLRGANFAQASLDPSGRGAGFLHVITNANNELYPADQVKPFDAQKPTLVVTTPKLDLPDPIVTLTINASDGPAGTGVKRVTIRVGDQIVNERTANLTPIPVQYNETIVVPCNTNNIHVNITVVDGVGLEASQQLLLTCDDRDPTGRLIATFYVPAAPEYVQINDEGTDAVYSIPLDQDHLRSLLPNASNEPMKIVRFWDQLCFSAPSCGDPDNVPLIRARFSDQDSIDYGTPSDELRVKYEYWGPSSLGRNILKYSSRDMSLRNINGPNGNCEGCIEVPISEEALSQDLHKSLPNQKHTIRFIATDRVGRQKVIDYDFYLELLSAKLRIGQCTTTAELKGKNLANNQTESIVGPGFDLVTAYISFPVSAPYVSGPLLVSPTQAPSFSLELNELRHEKGLAPKSQQNIGPSCSQSNDLPGFNQFWSIERQRVPVQNCDSLHAGGGPAANALISKDPNAVDPLDPSRIVSTAYSFLYNYWSFVSRPTFTMFDPDTGQDLRDPQNPTIITIPTGSRRKRFVINSGPTQAYWGTEIFRWKSYKLYEGQGSDVSTTRYIAEDTVWNQSRRSPATTESWYAPVYISKMTATVGMPTFTAVHKELPGVRIDVEMDPSCSQLVETWTELIGNRW